jgi:hypothetical protein
MVGPQAIHRHQYQGAFLHRVGMQFKIRFLWHFLCINFLKA